MLSLRVYVWGGLARILSFRFHTVDDKNPALPMIQLQQPPDKEALGPCCSRSGLRSLAESSHMLPGSKFSVAAETLSAENKNSYRAFDGLFLARLRFLRTVQRSECVFTAGSPKQNPKS